MRLVVMNLCYFELMCVDGHARRAVLCNFTE